MDRHTLCNGHGSSSREIAGWIRHCCIMCGIVMIVAGGVLLLKVTGLLPLTPVFAGSVFPLILIVAGSALLVRALRRSKP